MRMVLHILSNSTRSKLFEHNKLLAVRLQMLEGKKCPKLAKNVTFVQILKNKLLIGRAPSM